jgi:hypothetical protein
MMQKVTGEFQIGDIVQTKTYHELATVIAKTWSSCDKEYRYSLKLNANTGPFEAHYILDISSRLLELVDDE